MPLIYNMVSARLFNLFSLLVCVSAKIGGINHGHGGHQNMTLLQELEVMNELYYQSQLDERKKVMADEFRLVGANYACLLGVYPVGGPGAVMDGHKYLCGLHAIAGPPIVYSFGSCADPNFENSMLSIRPDAKIFVFEIIPNLLPAVKDPRVTYINIGLGGYDGKDKESHGYAVRTMKNTMKTLGHNYIDVLKVDIEGFEFLWLKNEGSELLPRVGQFSCEIHVNTEMHKALYPKENTVTYVEAVEKTGMRLFHKEINHQVPHLAIEVSFVQQKWISWDQNKRRLEPLV